MTARSKSSRHRFSGSHSRASVGTIVLIAFLLAATLLPLIAVTSELVLASPDPGWLEDWGYRMEITINHDNVDANLENFPVMIYLDSSYTDFWNHCDSEANIAFTLSDGTTKLKREIELFDHTNDKLYAHVKVSDLSSTVDTDIYIYYDSTSHAQTNDVDTWDDNFIMVQHMKDITTSTTEDSTSYNNDGTKKGANEPLEVDGKIYKAQSCDGTDDHLDISDSATIRLQGDFTVEFWLKVDESKTADVLNKSDATYANYLIQLHNLGLDFYASSDGSSWGTAINGPDSSLTVGPWYYCVVTKTSSSCELFINMASQGSDGSPVTPATSATPLRFGGKRTVTAYSNVDFDEARFSNVARSSGWLSTTYNNQSSPSTFYSVGSEEASEVGWLTGWNRRKKQIVTGTTAGAQTNYQLKMTVHKGSGTDNTTDVFCGGYCRDDFGDIRWTTSSGTTLMHYWIESIESGVQAVFWVEIPAIPTGAGTVDAYLYYDNPDATSLSDGDATFILFDDFAGTTIDTSKWTEVDTGANYITQDDKLIFSGGPSAWGQVGIYSVVNFERPFVFECKYKTSSTASSKGTGVKDTTAGVSYADVVYYVQHDVNSTIKYFEDSVWRGDVGSYSADTDYWLKQVVLTTGCESYNGIDKSDWTLLYDSSYSSETPLKVAAVTYNGPQEVDDVIVRKYAVPEPTWGAWGGEETIIELWEYYNTGDDVSYFVGGVNWVAQTFTTIENNHSVTLIKVKLLRVGTPGTCTISIRETDENGHPTGGDLTSTTFDGNALTTDVAGVWYDYSVDARGLKANTKYAIVLRAPSGDVSNYLRWRADSTDPTYTEGNRESSDDSGVNWTTGYGEDLMFEVWGEAGLYEFYNKGDDGGYYTSGIYWRAQTFTVGTPGHTISSIKLKLYRVGEPGTTCTIGIRATDEWGEPTGEDLTYADFNGNTLTVDTAGEWYEYSVSGYTLDANTKYAIVLRAPSGDGSNYIKWRFDESSPTYTEGSCAISSNSGSSWSLITAIDFMFEIWGSRLPPQEYERSVEQGFALAGLAPSGAEFGHVIEQGFSLGAIIAIIMEICKLLSQTLGFTGVVGITSGLSRSLTQEFSLDGEVEANRELSRSVAQDFSLTSDVSRSLGATRSISQTFSISDSLSAIKEVAYAVSQEFSLSDEVSAAMERWGGISQGFSFDAEVSANMERWGSIDQAFSVEGIVSRELEAGRSIVQSFSLTGVVGADREVSKNIAQDFEFADFVEANREFDVGVTQDFSLAAEISANMEWCGGLIQGFSFTGEVSAAMERLGEIDQPFSVGGVVSMGLEAGRGVAQSFALAGVVGLNQEVSREIAQGFSLAESLIAEKRIAINLSETFSLSATVTGPVSFVRELSEELSFTATLGAQYEYYVPLSEEFGLDATVYIALQKTVGITQGFALTGAVQALRESGISIIQTYSISDAVMVGVEYGRNIVQDYSLNGLVAVSFEFIQAISQEFSFGDGVDIEVSRYVDVYSYDLSGEFSFTGAITIDAEYSRTVPQVFSFTDSIEIEVVHLKPEPVGPIEDQPLFVWAYGGADNFRLLVDNNLDFSSPCENRIVFENHYQIPPENALDNGVYYWKVIAYFDGEAVESDVWTFTVGGTGTAGIDLISTAMFIFPIVLMGVALAFDNPVFASFAGVVFILSGFFFIDTIWLTMIFIGVGVYLLITAFMSEED